MTNPHASRTPGTQGVAAYRGGKGKRRLMTTPSIFGKKSPIAALSVTAAILATSSVASANRTYGAVAGTTATKTFGQWSQFNLTGVQNDATAARDWLIPVDVSQENC